MSGGAGLCSLMMPKRPVLSLRDLKKKKKKVARCWPNDKKFFFFFKALFSVTRKEMCKQVCTGENREGKKVSTCILEEQEW